MVTDAGFVPWAESGISTLVGRRPFDSCQARISSSPVNSPWAPAAGWSVAAAVPVTSHRIRSRSASSASHPWISSPGWAGWQLARPGIAATASHSLGLYFIVHDPSG